MQRYFAVNDNLDLNKSDIYHMYKVMRMKKGSKIEVVYNKEVNTCQIVEISVNHVKLEKLEKQVLNEELSFSITIAISLVSEQKWDYILQKSTELGVSEIIPLALDRTLIKIEPEKYNKKLERWTKICKEASEQSHRTNIPSILKIMTVDDLIKTDYDIKIVCSTTNDAIKLKQLLSNNKNYGRILVVIGPEGGITPKEEQILVENGFLKASLGKLILRVETVPLFILSVINYELTR